MKYTQNMVVTSLMMGLIIVCTMFIKIPIPLTTGYVHLGDAMIYLSVLLLGWRYSALAAAFGSTLGDLLSGFAMWAPWTFAIKGGMALIAGVIIFSFSRNNRKPTLANNLTAMIPAGIFMVVGYFLAEGIMYGNWIAPWLGVPWNIGQFVVGILLAIVIQKALGKTNILRV